MICRLVSNHLFGPSILVSEPPHSCTQLLPRSLKLTRCWGLHCQVVVHDICHPSPHRSAFSLYYPSFTFPFLVLLVLHWSKSSVWYGKVLVWDACLPSSLWFSFSHITLFIFLSFVSCYTAHLVGSSHPLRFCQSWLAYRLIQCYFNKYTCCVGITFLDLRQFSICIIHVALYYPCQAVWCYIHGSNTPSSSLKYRCLSVSLLLKIRFCESIVVFKYSILVRMVWNVRNVWKMSCIVTEWTIA